MPDTTLESALRARGLMMVAGVDEAGRGPLAGPVSAAAVILPPRWRCKGVDDSKKLTPAKREQLYEKVTTDSRVIWAVAFAEVEEIDRINILRATHAAMARAVEALSCAVDHCLIDGLPVPSFPWPHDGVVKGDGKSLSIAAASVIAKVSRDRLMLEMSREFPEYGFERHMGYGTKQHLAALERHGPCRHHRRSFQPVAQLSLPFGPA
ncbi:ribonuclease HII [Luteolibacter flavescens]|uniref:Ribonuclease HII n=1 Tax=Luteolibacter flavescens TaxID=1859460 RepID=A0ABT3FQ78_9BACT|nr:ribonuclease HII [Luteolibacter flavescens]MCW1885735.1 ribonuclease HII [Luteolibacter flavescens]